MSDYKKQLPQSVVQKWRLWASDPAFEAGIGFLRYSKAPSIPQDRSAADKFEAAVEWNGYQSALNDVESLLTELPKQTGDLDEPPIRG